jgi:CRP-like cAMP-binding protein
MPRGKGDVEMKSGDPAESNELRPWLRESTSGLIAQELNSEGTPRRAPSTKDFATTWLMQGVPETELAILAPWCEDRHLTAGETVFKKGDASDGLFLLLSGTVRIIAHPNGNETLLASVGAGECFGEMGVIDGEPRSATAVTATLASVRFVPTEPFLDLLERVPLVSMKLLALLSDRLRRTNALVADLPGEINHAHQEIEEG